MIDEYTAALKAGKKEYKEMQSKGVSPYLPALDDIAPDADVLPHLPLGLMEIPVRLIAGTKTGARKNSFAPGFMPLLGDETEFAAKWSNLYKAQIREGFNDPIKVYEYLHRFYVLEGNKRVSVSRYLDMPTIMAQVTRIMPSPDVLAQNPAYEEFLRFYHVSRIYDIECTCAGAYAEIAELLGRDLEDEWPEDVRAGLRWAYWRFSVVYGELGSKMPDLPVGDAFLIYLRIYVRDALRDQPKDVVTKRVLRIRKEFLTEKNEDSVELVESSEEAIEAGSLIKKTGTLVGKVLPVLSYTEKHPFKAAFVYDKAVGDARRIADHDEGRQRLEQAYGGTVRTRAYENCCDSASFEAAVADAAAWGADAVFTISPSQINDALRAAIQYPDIRFLNCSVNLAHQAVRTYDVKLYEAKFLAGLAAGAAAAADGTHKIGYCSDYPIYGTIAAINAFAIGAAMTDPAVRVYLKWDSREHEDWWWEILDEGIHVISATDSMHSADGSDAHGLCYVTRCEPGEGNDLSGTCRIEHLAVPIYKWGKFYELIVKTMIEGTYTADLVDKKDQATNYWWGMETGAVDIVLSDNISPYTAQLIRVLRRDITDGCFSPFDGELMSQEGPVKKEGKTLGSRDIITMDWLNENIVGEIPVIDSLKDEAKTTVKYSGVGRTKAGRKP